MRNQIYFLFILLFTIKLSVASFGQNNTFNNRNVFISACDSCVIENESFSSFLGGQEVESLFAGIVTFNIPYPTIFAGGWQYHCSSNEFSGRGLIPEERFEGRPLVMDFCPPVFGVGASVYDDHDGSPMTNELMLSLVTTQGDTFSINETCPSYGEVGFLGGISSDFIIQAIWSIDNLDGNLEIDNLTICTKDNSNFISVDFGNDTTICENDTILLNAYHPYAVSYIWQDGSMNSLYTVNQAGVYAVTISDVNNCSISDSVVILDSLNCTPCPSFGIPNVFTPNDDQVNDIFYVFSDGEFEIIDLKIYSRWGNLVHNTDEPWDGTYKGEPVPSDVYIYIISLRTDCESKQFSGDVTLIR